MPYTVKERQRRFKAKMYERGFKQVLLWVKRKEPKRAVKMSQGEFVNNLKKLTAGWDGDDLSQLYGLLIKIIKAKKEAARLREKT